MLEIKLDSRFKLKDNFALHEIADLDKYWLFNLDTGDIYSLNAVSMLILRSLRKSRSMSQLMTVLLSEYDVDEDVALADLKEIILSFVDEKIVLEERED